MFVIAFTGHRPPKIGGYNENNPMLCEIRDWTTQILSKYKVKYPELQAISGMALGFDMLAAEICVDLNIPFIAAIPFKGQESKWPEISQGKYLALLAQAQSTITVCTGGYESWKMKTRNIWMVDHCNLLIACWNGTPGGTSHAIAYAKKIKKPQVIYNPITKDTLWLDEVIK